MLSGFSSYLPEDLLTVWDNLEFLIRILMAALLGLMIGLERSRRQKDAGIRTHCIIAVTSATIMILSKYAFVDIASVDGLRSADPARIAAQVVSGISFLGAGVIFKDRNSSSIKGLTTAAGMWATSNDHPLPGAYHTGGEHGADGGEQGYPPYQRVRELYQSFYIIRKALCPWDRALLTYIGTSRSRIAYREGRDRHVERGAAADLPEPVLAAASGRQQRVISEAADSGGGAGVSGTVCPGRFGRPQCAGRAQPAPCGTYYQKDVI